GVETSHLIDVYHKYGLEAFAQTDLDKRVHENKPTQALGKMAFGILQTFIKRAKALGVFEKAEHETILRQFQVKENHYEQNLMEIIEEERPPMIEIEEYRKKFKK
ncbi:MAG: glucosyl-3-phosphoglycerate synthase, partial [Bacteroidetes bacterium]|nr:glucosyl-3-phosphoglycerate synthase [Bacteroidota bacterium]